MRTIIIGNNKNLGNNKNWKIIQENKGTNVMKLERGTIKKYVGNN